MTGIETISRQWICRRIRADREAGGHLYLRRSGRKRKPSKAPGEARRGRADISERPAVVEDSSRVGDWEIEAIIGVGHEGVIVSSAD